MDSCEALARDHLLGRGYRDVVYEPDGKVPPDFVLDGRIAVEVRRLNQNERHPTRAIGLNVVAGPLLARIQSLCHEHGAANGASWWVTVRFRRPVPPRDRLLAETRTFLDGVRSRRSSRQAVIDTVELRAIPRPDQRGKTFELGVVVDEDSHGPVFGELERNLRLVIHEKSLKIGPVRSRYPEWWLVLVDHVAHGLSREDQAEFRRTMHIAQDWDRIVVMNPLDPLDYFELGCTPRDARHLLA